MRASAPCLENSAQQDLQDDVTSFNKLDSCGIKKPLSTQSPKPPLQTL